MSTLTEAVTRASQVAFANNANIKISGSGNSGAVKNNSNVNLFSCNSNLNLKNNGNANLYLKNSTLDCVNSSNVNLHCEGGVLKINNDVNLKISSKSSKVESSRNKNLNLIVTGTEVILENNANINLRTRDGYIRAKNNKNLNIFGENNWVSVENTKNHKIGPSNTQNTNKLLFVFKPDKVSRIITWCSEVFPFSMTICGLNEVKCSIEYVDKAEINGGNYSTGMFNYVITKNSDFDLEIKVEGEQFESLTTEYIPPSQVILSAVKNDKKERLSIEAWRIVQEEGSREQPIFRIITRDPPSARQPRAPYSRQLQETIDYLRKFTFKKKLVFYKRN